jgi:hypothetical protein
MVYLTNLISQSSFDISPIWIPLISSEVSSSQKSVWRDKFFMGFICFYKVLVPNIQFLLHRWD